MKQKVVEAVETAIFSELVHHNHLIKYAKLNKSHLK